MLLNSLFDQIIILFCQETFSNDDSYVFLGCYE